MSRWKAFATHLLLSVLALGGVLSAMVWIWYPPPLFAASGVQQFVSVFVAVDIVIGPLLTLLIFNNKPRHLLRFDLACIALLQLAAFLYGLNIVRETRPVYLVAAEGRITMVTANMLDPSERESALPAYQKDPWFRPKLVAVIEPEDPVAFGGRLAHALNSGYPAQSVPRFYEPYERIAPQLLESAKPLQVLADSGIEASAEVQRFLRKHARNAESLVWVPFRAPDRPLSAALDASSGAFVGLLDIDPKATLSDA